MRLQIKTLAGPLVPIEVADRATVNDLKRRIHDACPEAACKKIRLMKPQRGGKFSELVKSEKLLSSIGMKDGAELSLVFDEFQEFKRVLLLSLRFECVFRFYHLDMRMYWSGSKRQNVYNLYEGIWRFCFSGSWFSIFFERN
jgi:hypothetical protein